MNEINRIQKDSEQGRQLFIPGTADTKKRRELQKKHCHAGYDEVLHGYQ